MGWSRRWGICCICWDGKYIADCGMRTLKWGFRNPKSKTRNPKLEDRMKGSTWRIILIAATIVVAVWWLYPTLRLYSMSESERVGLRETDPTALENLQDGAIKLGLDLQGGVHMVLEVDMSDLSEDERSDAVDRAIKVIRNRVDEFGVSEPVIHKEGKDRIVVELPGVQEIERAKRLVGQTARLEFKMVEPLEERGALIDRIDAATASAGPDTMQAPPEEAEAEEGLFEEQETLEGIEGEEGFEARSLKSLIVQLGRDLIVPKDNVPRVKAILADSAVRALIPEQGEFLWSDRLERIRNVDAYRLYYLKTQEEMTGAMVGDAKVSRGQGADPSVAGRPVVNFTTTDNGVKTFARITGANVGEYMAIVLDKKVVSAPRIKDKIAHGRSIITGSTTMEDAKDLAIVLRAGALPSDLIPIEDRTVGPSLGRDSIRQGTQAALFGLAVVIVFMVVYYGFAGIVADLALFLNIAFIMGVLAYFHATLTLPGIAGIILTIGIAVDANVLIFERIREELRTGKTVRAAIDSGYSRALSAIVDSNITTLIAAIVLYQFGTGPIKGFAVTLSIGVCASMFTALFVTRTIFNVIVARWRIRNLSIGKLRVFIEANFPFMQVRKFGFLGSAAVILIGLISLVVHGGPNFGVDFQGGTLLELHFDPPVQVAAIRDALVDVPMDGKVLDLSKSEIKKFGTPNDVLIRAEDTGEGTAVADGIKDRLHDVFPDNLAGPDWLRRQEKVGPKIGRELQRNAVKTVIWALIFIIGYISWRFRNFRFGVAAVVALVHDVTITVGVLSLMNREFSLTVLAALLTIVGYSLNDTIVIFDRIREKLRAYRREPYETVVNRSINECLSRTTLTSLTTLFVVAILLLLGGEVIRDFAVALFVGVTIGTYSSIFVASPVLVEWQLWTERRRTKDRGERARQQTRG